MHIRLALVQPLTYPPPDDEKNVDEAVRWVEKAAGLGADFVLFPESYPGPWRMPATFDPTPVMVAAAKEHRTHVVFGTLEPINTIEGTAHQLAVIAYPDASAPGIYRRTHPPGPWLYSGGAEWAFNYVAADEFPVFETAHGVVGLEVCSEIYMPEVSRALALRGAEIILVPAGTEKPELWATWRNLIWARATENLAVVATTQNLFRSTQKGLAMVAGPEGVLFESVAPGLFLVSFELDRARELRRSVDGADSASAAKAGVLTQWQRPELRDRIYPGNRRRSHLVG